ncbi:MAG TPA: hypothetical protein VMY99_00435 [Nevskiaceae bacterium]|nr:hypothetical protein [Nevskiaceae bacterium]
MEKLDDLLGRYSPQEPSEVVAIKRYIDEQFHMPASVGMQANAITITVANASLANALRLQTLKIQAAAQTDKRLVFRIG